MQRTHQQHPTRPLLASQRSPWRNRCYLLGTMLLLSIITYAACTNINESTTSTSANSATSANEHSPSISHHRVQIQTDNTHVIGTSQFSTGMSYVDNSLDEQEGNPTAIANIKSLIQQSITYQNTYLMAWGAPDPWPDPNQSEPSNWSYLDGRMHLIEQTGGIPVISLGEAPWWMKGQLQADGTTITLNQDQEWSDIAYSARILDNKMDAWLHLVQCAAERYMAPPYNVRIFQVWNELKGYYNPHTKDYDYGTNAGDLNGDNATHGYTYMYNQVYTSLMEVADKLHIPRNSIKVGGPYIPINTFGNLKWHKNSPLKTSYGNYDQHALNVVKYWLQHKAGGAFIALDGGNGNDDNLNPADAFTASEKFADVTMWVRSLNNTQYPGAATLPIWWSEWYAMPYGTKENDAYNNALKAYAIVKLIQAGGTVALSWGGGTGIKAVDTGLWTDPRNPDGGRPKPWFYSYKAIKSYFPPNTALYKTNISDTTLVAALASRTHIMIINKTNTTITVELNGHSIQFQPFQVRIEPL